MYDYREAVKSDILDYIKENYTNDQIGEELADRDEWELRLNDDLWVCDGVTGNASGSYYFNAYKAEEAICHNWDILAEAIDEFGVDTDILRQGAESCDVIIRCYLLGECLAAVLDELEEEHGAIIPMF